MRTDKPFKSFRAVVDLKQFVEWWDTYNQERYGDFPVTVSTGLCDGIATSRPGELPMYYVLFDDMVRTRVPQSFVKPFKSDEDEAPDLIDFPFPVTVNLNAFDSTRYPHPDTVKGYARNGINNLNTGVYKLNIRFADGNVEHIPADLVNITADPSQLPPLDILKVAKDLETVAHEYTSLDTVTENSLLMGIYEAVYLLRNSPLPDTPPGAITITDIDPDRLIAALEGYKRQPATGGMVDFPKLYTVGADMGTPDPSPTVVKVDRVDSQPYTTPIRPGKWHVKASIAHDGYYRIWASDMSEESTADDLVCDLLDAEDAQHIVELHNRNLGIGATPPVFEANQTGKKPVPPEWSIPQTDDKNYPHLIDNKGVIRSPREMLRGKWYVKQNADSGGYEIFAHDRGIGRQIGVTFYEQDANYLVAVHNSHPSLAED